MVFEETTGVYERIYLFFFQMCKKKREICEKEISFVGVESKK